MKNALIGKDVWGGFKKYFNIESIFIHRELTMITGKYHFDLLAFELWLEKQGYLFNEDESIAIFIQKKYGKKVRQFISDLL